MIGWFVWGAMDLARTIEYAVQAGWSLIVSFIWLLLLTGLGTTESGIDCRVIGVVAITSEFVSAASELAVAIFGLGGARVICCIFATGQPTILSRTEAGHECREGCHGFWLFLAEVAGEPFITDAMFKGRYGFGIRTINDLVLFS